MKAMSVVWADAAGNTTITRINSTAGATAIETAILAAINAGINAEWEGTVNTSSPTPVAAPYQSVTQRAVLTFQTAGGNNVLLVLPAPQAGIFLPDGVTVDPSNALVVALVAACVGALTDSAGNVVTTFIAGTLQ